MSRKRILCVEDHPSISRLIAVILEKYEVIFAAGIKDALRLMELEKFSLYLLDSNLADGTGLELCLEIKKSDKETPILFVAGTSLLTLEQVVQNGGQGLVSKLSSSFVQDLQDAVDPLLETGTPDAV